MRLSTLIGFILPLSALTAASLVRRDATELLDRLTDGVNNAAKDFGEVFSIGFRTGKSDIHGAAARILGTLVSPQLTLKTVRSHVTKDQVILNFDIFSIASDFGFTLIIIEDENHNTFKCNETSVGDLCMSVSNGRTALESANSDLAAFSTGGP